MGWLGRVLRIVGWNDEGEDCELALVDRGDCELASDNFRWDM